MRVFKIVLSALIVLMFSMALLPLFGLDLVLFGQVELSAAKPVEDANLHLFMVRSAAFATFAIFALNFLRRRRPLSSVAPYCISARGL